MAAQTPVGGPLPDSYYSLLVSYKRNGEAVPTPLWIAQDGERWVFRTEAGTGKVRRIRNDPRVRVAPCTVRGRPTGPPVEAVAAVVGPEDDAAEHALAAKYGWRRRAYTRFAPLDDMVYVEIRVRPGG